MSLCTDNLGDIVEYLESAVLIFKDHEDNLGVRIAKVKVDGLKI